MANEREVAGFGQKASETIENTVNSIRVAPQWYIPAIVSGSLGTLFGYKTVKQLLDSKISESIPTAAFTLAFAFVFGISERMTAAYLADFLRIKKSLTTHGWDERIIEPMVDYPCGRRAAKVAAIDAGYTKEIKDFYQTH